MKFFFLQALEIEPLKSIVIPNLFKRIVHSVKELRNLKNVQLNDDSILLFFPGFFFFINFFLILYCLFNFLLS